MQKVLGIINLKDTTNNFQGLTTHRPVSSLAYGSRYRVIDFTLSALVGHGVRYVGMFSSKPYRSLIEHIDTGRYWGLDRKIGGLNRLYQTDDENGFVASEISNYYANLDYIASTKTEDVVITSGDIVWNPNLEEIYSEWQASGVDAMIVYKRMENNDSNYSKGTILTTDDAKMVTSFGINGGLQDEVNYSLGTFFMKKTLFEQLIREAVEITRCRTLQQIIEMKLDSLTIKAYEYEENAYHIRTLEGYYKANMALLEPTIWEDIFNTDKPQISTKGKDEVPTYYGGESVVENTIIGTGTIIEGTVKNSLLSRRVVIEEGAVVENSIILKGCVIRKGVHLNNAIIDKNSDIGNEIQLNGSSNFPFVVPKRTIMR
ncbi:MAG: glucose-1-phosphate adenylyltransferase subunit GlgD [Culicoidibacterales bacterium]